MDNLCLLADMDGLAGVSLDQGPRILEAAW